ncbi:MAG: gliding motility-associated C-terminal domain-containing protein [Bacteroidota bacterium]
MRRQLALTVFLFPVLLWGQLTCDEEFILSGSATLQGECIRMTQDATGQLGCAWFYTETDFSMPFTNTMTVNFGNNNNGADGICLVYQSNNTTICGISGEGIGAQGIPNSFIVEFDTYQNGNLGDPFNDHAGININGDFTNNIDGPIDLGNIEDGNDHDISFSWDPGTNTYEVYFDGILIMTGTYDIINNCFGGSPFAFWGYTSSTGGETNEHLVCPGLPPEVIADAGTTIELPCLGAVAMLDGSGSDSGAEFSYEWTTSDGNIVSGEFTTNPTIDAEGTYTLTVFNNITLCESTDEVTVTIGEIEAFLDIPPFLDCLTGEVILSGAGSSSGPNITYQWSTPDGNITDENGDEATVNQPGTYTLTVVYDDGQGICMEEATVVVEEDPDVPVAFALDEVITCDPPFVELDGTGSSEGSVYTYEWTTPDGIILGGGTTLFPTVGAEGMYTLVVTNPFSGCTDEYDVFVTGDLDTPDAIATVDGELGCSTSSLTIDGTLSSFGPFITYEWTTTNGNIVSGADEDSPVVNQAGDYTLVVTDTENGCTAETTVMVDGGNNNVDVLIANPADLTCQITTVELDGNGSQPTTGVTYEWTTSDGQIDTDPTALQVSVGSFGTHTLVITETATGCVGSASVVVAQDVVPPTAEAGMATPFGCSDTSQQLDGSGSSTGTFTYNWTTTDGVILNGQNTLIPQVGAAGTYTLEVINTENGCSATDAVVVPADSDTPTVQIALNDTLDCTVSSLALDALGSTSGTGFTTTWSTSDGNFTGGTDGLQPIVDQPGTYSLLIVDDGNGCSNMASVTVVQDTQNPMAQIALPDTLDCAVTSLVVDASTSSTGAPFSYSWTSMDGTIDGATNALTATVSEPGSYSFTVVNNQNGCQDSALVVIIEDVLTPELSIAAPTDLNCTQTSLTLQASLTDNIPAPTYQWSTPDGNIVSGAGSLQALIDADGTYQLIALNTQNQCADTASVTVLEDITPPQADAGADQLLDCTVLDQDLGGNSSTGNNFSYQWTSPNATITDEDTLANLNTTVPGTFILQVTNTTNTCVALDTVVVSQDVIAPMAAISTPPLLTCTDSLSLLDGSGSNGMTNLSFAWSTPNGSLVGDPTANQLNAGQSGTYQLIVTEMGNGCSDTTTVEVLQDDNFPTAMIDLPLELTCDRLSLNLNGTANSASGNTVFNWSTLDGNIVANDNTLEPEVDQPGTYTLTVEDGNNNCQAQAQIVVALDTIAPIAAAGLDTLLNCVRTQLALDGSGSSQGGNISYTWSTLDGSILSGESSQTPTIGAAGTYALEVFDAVNGCRASDELLVSIDTLAPMIQIAPPITLTCLDTIAALDASASTTTGMAAYVWTSVDGNTITSSDMAQASVMLSGTYALQLTDLANGCVTNSSITVLDDLMPPSPDIAVPDVLTCAVTSLNLDATASTGTNLSFTWSSMDGTISANANTATPTIATPGQYDLLVTNGSNGCTAVAAIEVISDTEPPLVIILDPLGVDCFTPQVGLTAFVGSNTGLNPEYLWTSTDGSILADETTLTPTVNAEGTYVLQVTNTDNGCFAFDTTFVREDLEVPVIDFAAVDRLDCFNGTVQVDASNSTGNSNLMFEWNSPNGNIITSNTTATITVDAPGDYGLLLTNTGNGCTDSLGLLVTQDTITPSLAITAPGMLDCTTPSLVIDATGSDSGGVFVLNWTTTDGQIDAGENGPMPTISEPGTYTLTIQNTDNGCENEGSVEVDQDDEVPVVIFADPDLLTCVVNAIALDATQSSMGTSLIYTWTTTNGQIISGEDGLTPQVGEPGDYLLTIMDSSNGCTNDAILTVNEDVVLPLASAGVDFTLDCLADTDLLNGVGSSQGAIFTYLWSTGNGSLLEGQTSLSPSIDAAGTYQLLVTNTQNGCTAIDDVIVVENIPTGMLELTQPLCFGDAGNIIFSNVQGGTPPYLYTIDGGASLQLEPSFFGVQPGLYTAQVEDGNGCIYEEMAEVIRPDSLVVIFTEPELEINYGDSVLLQVQTNFPEANIAQILWENASTLSCDDCLKPYASPTESGLYRITVISENGCRDEALVRILVKRDFPIYFPSAFSPDGDGNNDFFYPFSRLGAVKEVRTFSIFDRWGNEVYTVGGFLPNDPRFGWDGTQGGSRYNPGVFVYMAEVELADGRIEIFKGDVTLIR